MTKRNGKRGYPAAKPHSQHTVSYTTYINSPAWAAKRAERIALAGGRCEWIPDGRGADARCPDAAHTVHHRTYARLGNEKLDDLRAYCQKHHNLADRQRKEASRMRALVQGGNFRRLYRKLKGITKFK